MTETEALARMISPAMKRPGKPSGGVIQILVTSSCDRACVNCTQGSQLQRPRWFMTPEQFEQAVRSLDGYFGVVGLFGGNPAVSPHFLAYCEILRRHVPKARCGIWCNNPIDEARARAMRETFAPNVSNLNVHLDAKAHALFREHWPESNPFGLTQDSRHSPPWVAMRDVEPDEGERWRLISGCSINKHWSAGVGVFRGKLRAWFCEIAMAQSILHQDDPDYPDTGFDPAIEWQNRADRSDVVRWWQLPMGRFAGQVRKHCHECGIPFNGFGALAQGAGVEQVSETHHLLYRPKPKGRAVELVTVRAQLKEGKIESATKYVQNALKE